MFREIQHSYDAPLLEIENARILIVDDEEHNRFILGEAISRMGITNIAKARDGEEALAIVDDFKPDLILLDVIMPKMDGHEVCQRLRSRYRHQDMAILFQTGRTESADRRLCFAVGATDYVRKPVDFEELRHRVRQHLEYLFLIRSLSEFQRRIDEGLGMAKKVQQSLMPQDEVLNTLASCCLISLAGDYVPSETLGGDGWGVKLQKDKDDETPVGLWLYGWDFSGHGTVASLNSVGLHAVLPSLIEDYGRVPDGESLSKIFDICNAAMIARLGRGQFATAFLGFIDFESDSFRYCAAGHTAPLLYRDGGINFYPCKGVPLGIAKLDSYMSHEITLKPRDILFFYSDALTEHEAAFKDGEAWLRDVFERDVIANGIEQPDLLIDRVKQAVSMDNQTSSANGLQDDLTLIAVKYKGQF